ncbi:NAD(P)-dependent dehydrogenase (short-subunit alcohol dehydrogenase family) [Trinickia symbiotica]|uniref:Short-chain dehydrogenase n=1 Tax=Trinickia symbiotica TaxID=863227 RepID=A0A2N7X4J9_9BURK|nr:SDR family NAD(P)-dependent oxidoreductase [Trinickia symbiotica]PMS36698.1 short-chain dehydrogenase [Trinickia symbiotica]PPK46143.1 NAD(P)-dependent dehydrogenase (short-subunit alcohol dehydrogenase family) [Trinickia symbiotica]
MHTKKLAEKVVIVTGGGQGVGLGVARALADDGANLVLTGRTEAKLTRAADELRDLGAQVLVVPGDTRNRADAVRTVELTVERFDRVDALVNNAQSSSPGVPLESVTDEDWRTTLESGLYGTLYFMQAVLPRMKLQGRGAIINFASRTGIEGLKGFGAYAAAKEGIRGLSRVAAREWGAHGITVNVICPAALTPAADAYLEANPQERTRYLSEIALGRFGDPQRDIGRAVAFLCSEDANFITGQTISVDGGQSML